MLTVNFYSIITFEIECKRGVGVRDIRNNILVLAFLYSYDFFVLCQCSRFPLYIIRCKTIKSRIQTAVCGAFRD